MGGLRVTTIRGIPVEIRLSFIFMLIAAFYGGILHGLGTHAVSVLILGCASVLLHEFGHALVARLFRVPTVGITLHAFGGETRLAAFPKRPRDEILIAAAGPLVSLLLAGIAGLWLLSSGSLWAEVLVAINLILATSNLLPALPLDGGRILRAALVSHLGLRRATDVAIHVARGVAVLAAIAAIFSGSWIILPLAGLLWVSAGHERPLVERWCFSEDSGGTVEVLDAEGHPAGRRATTLGGTYVIEEHRSALGRNWVVRDLSGRILLVTDTPLGAESDSALATSSSPPPTDRATDFADDTQAISPPEGAVFCLM
ncbi:MAG: M50 family metallopeptidase [Deltaproteobacteria bacterium]|nr:M50 family metallopeptidase [Deltaproteobacteria bacterium]